MASALSSSAAAILASASSPNSILNSSPPKSLFNSTCPQFIALDTQSALLAGALRKLNPYVRSLRRDEPCSICFSRVVSRLTIIRAYGGSDSANTPDRKDEEDDDQREEVLYDTPPSYESYGDGVEIAVEKIGRNQRRIRSKVAVQASLQTVWDILTDYERLADFIPGLAVSQLLEKGEKFARLFQVGEQNLAFGLKFNARGTIDCFERDVQTLPFGQQRDIDFKMVEGDFQLFEGKWSVEQETKNLNGGDLRSDSNMDQEFQTTLHYVVRVKPKVWLPVHLIEGRLCKEIMKNLSSIRKEAEKAFQTTQTAL
ncbi:uncharacterized protein LOC127258191 [Andrographis paniculata]|uniref:uncharacterized protein LOC127258191 n=1 Tax=Andrographis paniculata TaxID=175694 RepID=UPI0021E8BEF4|nr:uncharacterized protein LOC127258191 [Andrographis paniculata]